MAEQTPLYLHYLEVCECDFFAGMFSVNAHATTGPLTTEGPSFQNNLHADIHFLKNPYKEHEQKCTNTLHMAVFLHP